MSTPSKPTFVPPFFKNFGKATKDLFKKKYDFEHVVKSVNKTHNGFTIESGANLTADNRGFLKVKSQRQEGEYDVEVTTDIRSESKATAKLTKLMKGLTVTSTLSTLDSDKSFSRPTGSVDVEYSQDLFAMNVVCKSDLLATKVNVQSSFGYDGLSVACQAVIDASKSVEVKETNLGLEYNKNNFIASLFTEKNLDVLTASYYQRLNKETSFAASLRNEIAGQQQRSLTVGFEQSLDAFTTVKAKAEVPSAIVSTVIEQRFSNPQLLMTVASQFNTRNNFQVQKFGIAASVGDI